MMAVRRTLLYGATAAAGAVFEDWQGWELPRIFNDVASEYAAAQESCAVYDASHFGRINAVGSDVLDLLNRLSTNTVDGLAPAHGTVTILATDRGRILDLVTVANRGDHVLLLTSTNVQQEVIQRIEQYTFVEDVVLEDVTGLTSMLSVLGPGAATLIEEVLGVDARRLTPFESTLFVEGKGYILRRDLSHLPAFELVMGREAGQKVWEGLIGVGATPVGVEAYQVLRVAQGIPAYGHELGESYNPLEAGLIGAISFTKGCYIGQEVIARLDTYQKLQRRLAFLSFGGIENVVPGAGLELDGKEVGRVTSVAKVPVTGKLVGLGYVRIGQAQCGVELALAGVKGGRARVKSLVEYVGLEKN